MKHYLCLLFSVTLFQLGNAQISYPANMYADTNYPFTLGVASGDPLPNAVVIWTRVETSDLSSVQTGTWEISLDTTFQNLVTSGIFSTDSTADFTVNIDVQNLIPGTRYYYRFSDGQGNFSVIGRTKTAVIGNVSMVNIAVMSCSSVYSGFFNAYKRLGERDVLDAVIHLGDYVYDFVDEDEQIRVPAPYPQEPTNLADWRSLHRYYLMDPDLRFARSRHPWIALWDNHDRGGDGQLADGNQAFREYLPIRKNLRTLNDTLFRNFSFGNLAEIWMVDVGSYRTVDLFPGGEYNLMGNFQLNELIDGLKSSTAIWKIMGSQKMTGGWYTNGIDPALLELVPNDGTVFDNSSWDGYPETRTRIFDSLQLNGIDNFMALSGDAHISMAMDLVKNPFDSLIYDPISGAGSVGVEFLPSSISRGNLDEGGVPIFVVPAFVDISKGANPQHVYMDGTQHGYGLLHITPDSISATFCYSEILEITSTETYKKLLVKNGENHWSRNSSASINDFPDFFATSTPYPNPTNQRICLDFASTPPQGLMLTIYSLGTGSTVYSSSQVQQQFSTSVEGWAKGLYVMQLTDGYNTTYFKFLIN